MKDVLNMSIVIPTNGRVELVERLLKSLSTEREIYSYGQVEVIIVNSGSKEDSNNIKSLCEKYNAIFYAGENSVRKKRNLGIMKSKYEIILFLDSDVAAEEGLLKYHAEEYINSNDKQLGGVLGLTEFVGKKTWWWKVVEQTTYLDSFSFAKRFPYNSWTIGNNVSFYKKVLIEVGMFEENFPFPLGGDDLDMTYRITKSGYRIKSCSKAVTLHSTETWNRPKAIYDRTHRWGTMDYTLSKRHPEIFVDCIPKSGVLFLLVFLIASIISIVQRSTFPITFSAIWLEMHIVFTYIYDCLHKEGGNLIFYILGKLIKMWYRSYYILAGIKERDFACIHKEMSFTMQQTKYMQRREIGVFKLFLITFVITLGVFLIVK